MSKLFLVLALTACLFISVQSQGCRVCAHKSGATQFDDPSGFCRPVRGTLRVQVPATADNGEELNAFKQLFFVGCSERCTITSYANVDYSGRELVSTGPEENVVIPFCAHSYIAVCV